MQVTHPDLFGDLGDQIQVADLRLGIRQSVDGRRGRPQQKTTAIELPEFEYVDSAEWMEELMDFTTVSPGMESWMRDELGPGRFSRLMRLLFRVGQTDRMI